MKKQVMVVLNIYVNVIVVIKLLLDLINYQEAIQNHVDV